MQLIKLRSTVNYQTSACNHVVFLPEVDMSHEAIYPEPAKEPLHEDNAAFQSFSTPLEATPIPKILLCLVHLSDNFVCRIGLTLMRRPA